VGMTIEEENARLRAENEALQGELAAARQLATEFQQRIVVLEQRIVELEGKSDRQPPSFVKPNRPKREGPKQPRKKRDAKHDHARRRETPTRTVEHALDRCPECNYQLRGTSIDYVRQVIELPPPQPIEVTEHQVIKRFCPHCERWRSPRLDLTGLVLGQSRMGVRLVSLIAYLRNTLRAPFEAIQGYLETLHGLKLSEGEIVGLLHQARAETKPEVDALKAQMQAATILNADETGWREDGTNGYVWGFATEGAQAIRYYEHDASRAQPVLRRLLGNRFKGHLGSDFYYGYNDYECPKQRCWVHFLRALHDLKEQHPQEPDVLEWVQGLRALYDEATEWLERNRGPGQEERQRKYDDLVAKVRVLGLKYAQDRGHACWALCKRVLRHEDELFQFVLVEGLASNNNLAERSLRPLVVGRKISGGTRSPNGTKTRMALASLFATWQARGLNPFNECLNLLSRGRTPTLSPAQ
jgi:transposase